MVAARRHGAPVPPNPPARAPRERRAARPLNPFARQMPLAEFQARVTAQNVEEACKSAFRLGLVENLVWLYGAHRRSLRPPIDYLHYVTEGGGGVVDWVMGVCRPRTARGFMTYARGYALAGAADRALATYRAAAVIDRDAAESILATYYQGGAGPATMARFIELGIARQARALGR